MGSRCVLSSSSCGLSWCYGGTGIREEKKKRSGQAGLLVPKAATTARESLKHPPFATCEGGECLAGINDISPTS